MLDRVALGIVCCCILLAACAPTPNPDSVTGLIADDYGAYQAGDLPFVFGNFTGDHHDSTEPDETQRQVSRQMMRYWTNFARTGDPNGMGLRA